ncbi:Snl1p Ecym_4393 [Eremothecium cymbalariae DBVPG|uniref:BAG domain-containing protein n=1 Tax=Eremothecium cymbalariae (strain CBS 270.75 / DBVPG 7215 / KCTC 17166 / NRRL Y-17582) TaxID=931890 RepID=G8JTU4_ERECY|nr:hypothetical protein Ecym_4393 [Eremothecium cymbalariae DBVPG\
MDGILDKLTSFYGASKKGAPEVMQLLHEYTSGLVTVAVTTALGALLLVYVAGNRRAKAGKSKSAKKESKKKGGKPKAVRKECLTLEEGIEAVQRKFETEYKAGLTKLLEDFEPGNEKYEFECSYYNEMLLKLLIELDGIELTEVTGERKDMLKKKRKAAILTIQQQLKKLDKIRTQQR